jgi:hypothetical protein
MRFMLRSILSRRCWALLLFLACLPRGVAHGAEPAKRPNVLLILTDDRYWAISKSVEIVEKCRRQIHFFEGINLG